MAEVLPQIVLVLVLVLLKAAIAGTEMALVSLREGQCSVSSKWGLVMARPLAVMSTVVHLRDLLDGGDAPVRSIAREAPVLPPGDAVIDTPAACVRVAVVNQFVNNSLGWQ